MIEIDRITKEYGDTTAVDAVSLTAESGTITCIVGTSGSGKTTLLRLMPEADRKALLETLVKSDSDLAWRIADELAGTIDRLAPPEEDDGEDGEGDLSPEDI